jgi:Protein of unknown function (DUF551)
MQRRTNMVTHAEIAKLRELLKAAQGLGDWSVQCGDLLAFDPNDDDLWFIAKCASGEGSRIELAAAAVNALPKLLNSLSAYAPDKASPEVVKAAAVRALPDAWMPIDEAPQDGTPVLLAASHGVSVGWWEDSEPTFKWRFVDDFDLTPTGCCDHESDDRVECNGMEADAPTHFMPLPSPPEGE